MNDHNEPEEMIIQVGDLELHVRGSAERAPGVARQFVGEWFESRGNADVYTAQLIVSELVTNALQHGKGPVVVRVMRDESDELPVVEVEDGGNGLPIVQPESATAIDGRGLLLVSALAKEWGIRQLPGGGKVTWAKCAL